MATKDTTKPGVSADEVIKTADDYIKEQGTIERDGDVNDIVANAKIARQLEAAGVDMKNPMEVKLAKEKLARGEDPSPNAGKKDPYEDEGLEPEGLPDIQDNSKPEMIMVKINGVERKALKSDVDEAGGVVAYQKAMSADEKFKQAAEARRKNEEKEAILRERELAIARKEQALLNNNKNTEGQPSTDAGTVSETALRLKDKMYSGDDNVAAEAIQEILDATEKGATHLDPEQIVEKVATKVQWQVDLTNAKRMFAKEYKDIDGNAEYRKYADQQTNVIMGEHPDWTPTQIITEAGDRARIKFADQLREKTAKDENDARLANKRATDNVTSTGAKQAIKQPAKALSPKDIVAKIREGRSHAD